MLQDKKCILTNAIIILMIFFVCLPCPLKREIKQAMNIPVSSLENKVIRNSADVCGAVLNKTDKTVEIKHQKKSVKFSNNQFPALVQVRLAICVQPIYSQKKILNAVPVYLMNEQFLI